MIASAEPGRLFVSSAFGGMRDLRRAVADQAQALGFHAVLTEDLIGNPSTVAAVLERELAACDCYVGLFGERRGTVPAGEPTAITEQEWALAGKLGLRRLAFVDFRVQDRRSAELQAFLDNAVTSYRQGVYARPFTNLEDLRRELAAAMSPLRPRLDLHLEADGQARLDPAGLRPLLGTDAVAATWRPQVGDLPGWAGLADGGCDPGWAQDRQAAFGRTLWSWLDPVLQAPLAQALAAVRACGRTLVLRVCSSQIAALDLPWELLLPPDWDDFPVRCSRLCVLRRPGAVPDTLPALPPARFRVLGFTADPLDDEAGAPRPGLGGLAGGQRLNWEQEQDRLLRALEPVLQAGRGVLALPDTGDVEELQRRLCAPQAGGLLHLSCHGGGDAQGAPALMLEDKDGHRRPANAAFICAGCEPAAWDLVVLSACDTARAGPRRAAGDPGHGKGQGPATPSHLTANLSGMGFRRVLGMQGRVGDQAATNWAAAVYKALAQGLDLVAGLIAGGRALAQGLDWWLPAAWLAGDSGPLVQPADLRPVEAQPLELAAASIGSLGTGQYIGRRDFERRLHRAGARRLVCAPTPASATQWRR